MGFFTRKTEDQNYRRGCFWSAALLTHLTGGKHYLPPQMLPRVPNLTKSPKLTQSKQKYGTRGNIWGGR